jgi:hypothetical protein
MRYAFVFLFCPAFLFADEKAKPNTLTQKEIEEGWILLFDGETTFGWNVEGDVKANAGELILGGTRKSVALSTSAFPPCEVSFDFKCKDDVEININGHKETLFGDRSEDRWSAGKVTVTPTKEGKYWIRTDVKYPNGGMAGNAVQPAPWVQPIRFATRTAGQLHLRSIKLRPLSVQSLYNGKDLAGWKVFDDPKRNASRWSVTKEGWLNVKNGPGDLQTEKKFDDFILQFDCISNGKALNSGIFFRCIENQYQNGYEAQVQNGFKDNDRTKPADFGTGAIYRRVAARKVVPNDNEWFTMTVLAHGKHIATWVNGYQTVDWTDDRKENDNPRNGYRAAAGHISIQGHDPTTDLSFRNIRIVELGKEKKN